MWAIAYKAIISVTMLVSLQALVRSAAIIGFSVAVRKEIIRFSYKIILAQIRKDPRQASSKGVGLSLKIITTSLSSSCLRVKILKKKLILFLKKNFNF
jgi:hypothetical protein